MGRMESLTCNLNGGPLWVQSSAASVSARNIFQQRANSWGPFMVVYGTGQVSHCRPFGIYLGSLR